MANYYYEDVPNTPFGILVLPHISGGYHWFITKDGEDNEQESIIKCVSPLATPYDAVDDALSSLSSGLSLWIINVADKRREWMEQS